MFDLGAVKPHQL